jgi:hypothetical protein
VSNYWPLHTSSVIKYYSDRDESLSMNLMNIQVQTCPIDAWLKRTTHVQAQFNKLIKNDPIAYLETICTLYLADHNKDAIQEQTILLVSQRSTTAFWGWR